MPKMRKAPTVDLKELMSLRKKSVVVEKPQVAMQRTRTIKAEQIAEQTNERASPFLKNEASSGLGRNSINSPNCEVQESSDMKLMVRLGLDEDKLCQLRYFNSTNGDTLLDFKQEIEFLKYIKS